MMHPRAYKDFRAVVDALSLDASARDVLEALVGWVGISAIPYLEASERDSLDNA